MNHVDNMALGKKLDGIITDYFGQETVNLKSNGQEVQLIPIADITLNPHQTRRIFDEKKIRTLAQDIEKSGLIQPIVVLQKSGSFQLVAGERRLRACKLLMKTHVQAVVKHNLSESQQAIMMAMENLQREDLSPIEKAETFQLLQKYNQWDQQQLAEYMGVSVQYIKNYLRLLTLSDAAKEALLQRDLTEGQARHLVNLSEAEQKTMVERIIREELTVKEIQAILKRKEADKPLSQTPAYTKYHKLDDNLVKKAQKLSSFIPNSNLSCKGDETKGKIVISWG